jgi:hypothetical protein
MMATKKRTTKALQAKKPATGCSVSLELSTLETSIIQVDALSCLLDHLGDTNSELNCTMGCAFYALGNAARAIHERLQEDLSNIKRAYHQEGGAS